MYINLPVLQASAPAMNVREDVLQYIEKEKRNRCRSPKYREFQLFTDKILNNTDFLHCIKVTKYTIYIHGTVQISKDCVLKRTYNGPSHLGTSLYSDENLFFFTSQTNLPSSKNTYFHVCVLSNW